MNKNLFELMVKYGKVIQIDVVKDYDQDTHSCRIHFPNGGWETVDMSEGDIEKEIASFEDNLREEHLKIKAKFEADKAAFYKGMETKR